MKKLVIGGVVLAFRVLWQIAPGLPTCIAFWTVSLMLLIYCVRNDFSQRKPLWWLGIFTLIGLSLNAFVTIANEGYMPTLEEKTISIWASSTFANKFMFLGDIYFGFSIGDFFILSSIFIPFLLFPFLFFIYRNQRVCKVCEKTVPNNLCIEHVKQCWGMYYPSLESIPTTPPPQAYFSKQVV